MNKEQILECAEQSRLYAKSIIPNSVDDPIRWTYEYHKRFAELIVRECAEQIKTQGISASSEGYGDYEIGFNAGLFHALYTTKEHFGVEE